MNNIKPTPPTEVQELLKLIGFYTDGFCTGHCEHAPLRESNPELNAAIESWHDSQYSSPTHDDDVDISDYLIGEPGSDWRAVAIDLANAIQSYSPDTWQFEAPADMAQVMIKQMEWFVDNLIPALARFHMVHKMYAKHQATLADPF